MVCEQVLPRLHLARSENSTVAGCESSKSHGVGRLHTTFELVLFVSTRIGPIIEEFSNRNR